MTIQPTPIELDVLLDDDIAVDFDVIVQEEIPLDVCSQVEYAKYPFYDGEYIVTPSDVEQQLHTSGRIMKENVVVTQIPISLASRSQIDRLF